MIGSWFRGTPTVSLLRQTALQNTPFRGHINVRYVRVYFLLRAPMRFTQ